MPHIADIGGEIRLRLTTATGRIEAVKIVSTRPRGAARIFEGKTADEMCSTIGRVFSLCGAAQTVAALGAVEHALGIAPNPGVMTARDARRRAEILTQLVTRLALHWPRVLGLPLAPAAVRSAMAFERDIEARVLGNGWRHPGAELSAVDAEIALPEIDVDGLVAPLTAALAVRGLEAYGALPTGMSPEFGVLAAEWNAPAVMQVRRTHGAGLAARLAAAEAALRALPAAIRTDLGAVAACAARAPGRDTGQGTATVNTARGPLTHRVRIEAGVVTRCRTDAPTEANFAAAGPVAAGLAGAAPDPVAAELHVLAIDPCVACRVELAPG